MGTVFPEESSIVLAPGRSSISQSASMTDVGVSVAACAGRALRPTMVTAAAAANVVLLRMIIPVLLTSLKACQPIREESHEV